METVQVKIINPKAKKLLTGLQDLKLISISKEDKLFPLSDIQKKSISISRKEIKNGEHKSHSRVMKDAREWMKRK